MFFINSFLFFKQNDFKSYVIQSPVGRKKMGMSAIICQQSNTVKYLTFQHGQQLGYCSYFGVLTLLLSVSLPQLINRSQFPKWSFFPPLFLLNLDLLFIVFFFPLLNENKNRDDVKFFILKINRWGKNNRIFDTFFFCRKR